MNRTAPTPALPTDGICKSLGFLELRKADEATTGVPVFRITSEVLDRAKDRLMAAGMKVENFHRNPVLLWNHNSWEPAIGTAKVYQDQSGQWLMEPAFDGIGERSKEVSAKVAAGTLRTCSVRFRLLKYAFNEEGGLDIEEWELLEVSITNIPCNPEAERVKSQPKQQPQKNDPPPPDEDNADILPVLGKADLDSIGALVDAKFAPILEMMTKLEDSLAKMMEQEGDPEEEAPAEETPAPEEPEPTKSESVPPPSIFHLLGGRRS